MAGPASTMSLSQVVDPALIKMFDESRDQLATEAQYTMFPFTERQIEAENEKISRLSGYGLGGLTVEGQLYQVTTKVQGFEKTLVLRKYTQNAPFTEELDYFLKKRSSMGVLQVSSMMTGMASSLVQNWDTDWAKMFYLGFGTTFITGGDGLSLINAAHPSGTAGAPTQTNIITVGATANVALNATSLQAACVQLDRFRDNANTLMVPGKNKALITSRQGLEGAFRLKISEYGPDTANLGFGIVSPTISQAVGYSIKVFPLHYMPDAFQNYWFVVDLDRMKQMVFMAYMWKPRVSEKMVQLNGIDNILASTIFGPNPTDWRWIVGSTGVNAVP